METTNRQIKELSILIPVYNQVCVDKIEILKKLCDNINTLTYEIIVADDGSNNSYDVNQNERINKLEHCSFVVKPTNTGAADTRNFLADRSHYSRLLFLDCDMDIPDNDFIRRYLVHNEEAVVNGGIKIGGNYNDMKSNLRYIYEYDAEPKHTAKERTNRPYKEFRSTNFMIPREIMLACRFDNRFKRYEDVYFGKMLKQNGIKIIHIDNPTVMNDFENNTDYIYKVEKDLHTLNQFRKELHGYSQMLTFTDTLQHRMPLCLIKLWHKLFGNIERSNLTSNHPNLKVFNIYRLGYYISIRNN